ncbi:hypothetical protein C8Q78DRAFT_1098986, partial [Trametes maxima]
HWALSATYEHHDWACATVSRERPTTESSRCRVTHRVHLTSNHPSGTYGGRILLGEVNDDVLPTLEVQRHRHQARESAERRAWPGQRQLPQLGPHDRPQPRRCDISPAGAVARLEKCPHVG